MKATNVTAKKRVVQTTPRPAWTRDDVVLVARAPNDGATIQEWERRLKKHGLQLEEIMTPDAWERRNAKPEKP